MSYVMHICRNPKCNNGWIDKDLTRCTTFPPDWKYCKECAEKLGINFDAQTPDSNLTKKELEIKNQKRIQFERNKKSNLSRLNRGDFAS